MPTRSTFCPAQIWTDTTGRLISAHGGGILHHQGTYYWFGEDLDAVTVPHTTCEYRIPALGVRCYSSPDLFNWTDCGRVLATEEHSETAVSGSSISNPAKATDLHPGNVIQRPKVIYHAASRQFVMWLHIDREDYSLAAVGVAVADAPTGPYRYLGSTRPAGHDSRDCTVFAEGENAWLLHSSEGNSTLHVRPLAPSWLHVEPGVVTRTFAGEYREAPAVFKHADRYYQFSSHCTGWNPNPTRLATASRMGGPWTAHGNPCRGPRAETSFDGQPTFVFPVAGQPGAYIAMFDRWKKADLRDSRHIWLPVEWDDGMPFVQWHDEWDLSFFKRAAKAPAGD
jgi:beta-galactosidase